MIHSSHDRILAQLVDFALRAKSGTLSEAQEEAVVLRVIDSIGCGLAGSSVPAVRRICDSVLARGGAPMCGVLLRGRSSPENAAYLNGIMIRYLDLNDIYVGRNGSHPSDLVAGALAAGEFAGASGRAVVRALAAGMHVMMDFCDSADAYGAGWDHANYSAIASAIVSGMLLDLSPGEMANAISLTVMSGVMLIGRSGQLSTWKSLAGPLSVRNGLSGALLAQSGATGPDPVFEGDFGFIRRVSGPFSLELDAARDRTGDSYLKAYPAGYHIQAAIEACLELRDELGATLNDNEKVAQIKSIVVETYPKAQQSAADTRDKWSPDSHETADHSLPFLTALALSRGTLRASDIEAALHDEQVLALTQKVEVRIDERFAAVFPQRLPVRVTVQVGHRELVRELSAPLGHATRPMPRTAVEQKFRVNARDSLGDEDAYRCAEHLRGFAAFETVTGLFDTLSRLRS